MTKTDKKREHSIDDKGEAETKALYTIEPWSCRRFPDHIAVEAYVEAAGDWQTVAEVRPSAFIDPEVVAGFIVRAVNDFERNRQFIKEMVEALELCLDCPGLTWAAEHEAELLVARAKNK